MRVVEVTKKFRFEAAHQLPLHQGACSVMHGHSYRLEVTVAGPVDENGMVVDFEDLASVVRSRVTDRLDHTVLNDLIDNPTAENIALAAWDWVNPELSGLKRVVVHETASNSATVTSQ